MANYSKIKKPSEKLKGLLSFAGVDIKDFLPEHHKSFNVPAYGVAGQQNTLAGIRSIITDNINVISSRSRVESFLGVKEEEQDEAFTCCDEAKMWLMMKDMLDSWPDAIFFKNLSGELILVNEAHALGMRSKFTDVIGKRDSDLFPKAEAELMLRDDEYVIKTGKPIINKMEYITFGDGTRHYVSTTKVPRRDAKGNVIGTMGISRDVTDDLYQSLFASYKGCMYICTKDGQWFDINEEGALMFGYSSREKFLNSTTVQDLYFDKKDRKKNIYHIERNGGFKNHSVKFRKKDGTPIDIQITANVIIKNGKVWGYNGTMRDVTVERRAREENLKKIRNLTKQISRLKAFILKGITGALSALFVDEDKEICHMMGKLTSKQRELFPLFILGKSDKEISKMTNLSESDIAKYRYDIYRAK